MMMRKLIGLAALSVLTLGMLCDPNAPVPPPPCDNPNGAGIQFEKVAEGFDFAVSMAIAPDGRVFVTDKDSGIVHVIDPADGRLAQPFVDVPVCSNTERGLLGVAIHPNFPATPRVYLFYTRSATGQDSTNAADALENRVSYFEAAGNVAAGQEVVIASLPATGSGRHNAGNIHFGPDGKLYITIGDLQNTDSAQALAPLSGKILRYNDDGSIPADNPFGAAEPTFALGLRNSFDFTFDPVTGVIFATENGPNGHDEINRIVAGGNYGWPIVQGATDNNPPGEDGFAPQIGMAVDPVRDYTTTVVPTGIVFIPNDLYGADRQNSLLVCTYYGCRILRYELNATRDGLVNESLFAQQIPNGALDVEFAPDGTLRVLTSRELFRVVPE